VSSAGWQLHGVDPRFELPALPPNAATRAAPPDALELSLRDVRLAADSDAADSVVWCTARDLAAAPRAHVRLLGLTNRSWPRNTVDDPVLPSHVLSADEFDADPVGRADRRHFSVIRRVVLPVMKGRVFAQLQMQTSQLAQKRNELDICVQALAGRGVSLASVRGDHELDVNAMSPNEPKVCWLAYDEAVRPKLAQRFASAKDLAHSTLRGFFVKGKRAITCRLSYLSAAPIYLRLRKLHVSRSIVSRRLAEGERPALRRRMMPIVLKISGSVNRIARMIG
jgi:hypothetical protein